MISRRRILALASAAVSLRLLQRPGGASDGHLSVTPKAPRLKTSPGEQALGLGGGSGRDGLLVVPAGYRPDSPAPLAVMLHGAGGSARRVASLFSVADELGVIILAPESRGGTWDGIRGSYGPDIEFLNRALAHTFDRWPSTVGGSRSAGFPMAPRMDCPSVSQTATSLRTSSRARQASPSPARCAAVRESSCPTARPTRFFPSRATSRRIVPELEKSGYTVTYREFDGPHTVPPAIARDAFAWFTGANPRVQ